MDRLILVVNVGSTSFKYQLLKMPGMDCLSRGKVDRVFSGQAEFFWQNQNGKKHSMLLDARSGYEPCISQMLTILTQGSEKVMASLEEIAAVGFKTVMAGPLNRTVKVTPQVYEQMEKYNFVAPAHNPPYIAAMKAFEEVMPNVPLVAAFETSFHKQIPEERTVYAFPKELREKYGLRKYGFHGASHSYISWIVPQILGVQNNPKIISCHLGGSSSISAIQDGHSVDTSMGFSPQAGLPNNNRNGDIDVFAVLYLMEQENLSPVQMRQILSTDSGLKGISGISGDVRDLKSSSEPEANLALNHLVYSAKRYIGSFAAEMNGVDIVTFSGGIGENDPQTRAAICESMDYLGIKLDEEKNENLCGQIDGVGQVISADDSRVKVIVVPTNEELMVAMRVEQVLEEEER